MGGVEEWRSGEADDGRWDRGTEIGLSMLRCAKNVHGWTYEFYKWKCEKKNTSLTCLILKPLNFLLILSAREHLCPLSSASLFLLSPPSLQLSCNVQRFGAGQREDTTCWLMMNYFYYTSYFHTLQSWQICWERWIWCRHYGTLILGAFLLLLDGKDAKCLLTGMLASSLPLAQPPYPKLSASYAYTAPAINVQI